MTLIHHVVRGEGGPPIVFVHGFGCAHSDWDTQVAHLSRRHRTVAVDLRGHGLRPGTAAECSIERYGADVAEVMRDLALSHAVVVGHSMGCRVAIEAALQAPAQTSGVVLVDGSQFSAATEPVMRERFASPGGYESFSDALFNDMFTAKSDAAVVAAVVARAKRFPRQIGEKMLADLVHYDVGRLSASLASPRVPVMALQATYSNERRERMTMREGQSSPYLDMPRARVPSVRVEIIADTGHFPQLDAVERTNALIDDFLASLTVP
jgi:pimeloyl-ACP methyl ester carboxylesterase